MNAEQSLWDHALSKSTLTTYQSAISAFLRFLALSSGIPAMPDANGLLPSFSENCLTDFVNYCQSVLHLRHDTIKLYLAGIKFHYIKHNNVDILCDNLQLPYLLKAVKRTQCNVPTGLRLPITFDILVELCDVLSRGFYSQLVDLMLKCIYTTAFYGFLRCGEFTVSSISSSHIRASDVEVAADLSHFTLLLRTSKTDPFSKGVSILIYNSPPLFPVTIMSTYLSLRREYSKHPNTALFFEPPASNQPLSRHSFIHIFQILIQCRNFF